MGFGPCSIIHLLGVYNSPLEAATTRAGRNTLLFPTFHSGRGVRVVPRSLLICTTNPPKVCRRSGTAVGGVRPDANNRAYGFRGRGISRASRSTRSCHPQSVCGCVAEFHPGAWRSGRGPLRSSKALIGSRMRNGRLARKTPRSVELVLREREDPHRRNIPESSSRRTIALHQTGPRTHGLRNEMHLSRKRALIVLRCMHGFCDSSGTAPPSPPSKRWG